MKLECPLVYDGSLVHTVLKRMKRMSFIRRSVIFGPPVLAMLLVYRCILNNGSSDMLEAFLTLLLGAVFCIVYVFLAWLIFEAYVGERVDFDPEEWLLLAIENERFCLLQDDVQLFCNARKKPRIFSIGKEQAWIPKWDNIELGGFKCRVKMLLTFTINPHWLTPDGLNWLATSCLEAETAKKQLYAWLDETISFHEGIRVEQSGLDNNPFGFSNVRLELENIKMMPYVSKSLFEIR